MANSVGGGLTDPRQGRHRKIAQDFRQLWSDPLGTTASDFFGSSKNEDQRTLQGLAVQAARSLEALREERLHISSATTVKPVAVEFSLKRVASPSGLTLERHSANVARDD